MKKGTSEQNAQPIKTEEVHLILRDNLTIPYQYLY